jgi:hypothetical protein
MGVLEPYSTNPLLFALNHCRACYKDYQDFLAVRKRGDKYAADIELEWLRGPRS